MFSGENENPVKKIEKNSKKGLTTGSGCGILYRPSGESTKQTRKALQNLGVAQLGARYLGVVEAAGSSPVTQTKIGGSIEPPIFFYFLAKSLEISRFRDIHNGLVLPYFEG